MDVKFPYDIRILLNIVLCNKRRRWVGIVQCLSPFNENDAQIIILKVSDQCKEMEKTQQGCFYLQSFQEEAFLRK